MFEDSFEGRIREILDLLFRSKKVIVIKPFVPLSAISFSFRSCGKKKDITSIWARLEICFF